MPLPRRRVGVQGKQSLSDCGKSDAKDPILVAAGVRRLVGATVRIRSPAAAESNDGEVRGEARVADAACAGSLCLWHTRRRRCRSSPLQQGHHSKSSADARRHSGERNARLVSSFQGKTDFGTQGAEEVRRGHREGYDLHLYLVVSSADLIYQLYTCYVRCFYRFNSFKCV